MKDNRLKREIASLKLKCFICGQEAKGFFRAKPICTSHYKLGIKNKLREFQDDQPRT